MKLLILRLSSFGDIAQCTGVPAVFLAAYPQSQIHWVVRSDFQDLLKDHPSIHKVWPLDRNDGIRGLVKLIQQLRKENYTHIYDAHNNLRSRIICLFLKSKYFIRRSKDRIKRFLLFWFRKNLLPKPFIAQNSYLQPLASWGVIPGLPPAPQFFVKSGAFKNIQSIIPHPDYIALCPSAAWELKRWPVNYWKKLIELCEGENFVVLGGKEDLFCSELVLKGQEKRITNLAGRLSLVESCAVIEHAKLVISNDTGLAHVADQYGVKSISLIGPTAFGYPARESSKVLEIDLPCKPCSKDGRGKCRNQTYKKCLRDISPDKVRVAILEALNS